MNGSRRKRAEDALPGFDAFWAAWPANSRKTARPQCIAKWAAKKCEPIADLIVASVERHKACHIDWIRDSGQCIPAPLVWLNQERWNAPFPDKPPTLPGSPVTAAERTRQRLTAKFKGDDPVTSDRQDHCGVSA
jgi:hypothetical protein